MSEDFGPNFITLTDEDGNEFELEYIDALEVDGQTYMAFFPFLFPPAVVYYAQGESAAAVFSPHT